MIIPVIVRSPSSRPANNPSNHPKVELFVPYEQARYGYIMAWSPHEGHCEADLDYYRETIPPYYYPREAEELIEQYQRTLSPGTILQVRKRLPADWTRRAWRR